MIIAFTVKTMGPSGTRWFRVVDTDLTQATAELIAAQRYCIDTPTGLGRLDEVTATAGLGEQVAAHQPRPVLPTVAQ